MKVSHVQWFGKLCLSALVILSGGAAQAGWGSLGGSSGGYTGGSSGYAASYYGGSSGGSSGYAAYAAYGSSGHASYGSSGHAGHSGFLSRLHQRVHSALAHKHARHAARRAAYGSSGGYASYGSSGGYAYRTTYYYGSSGGTYGSSGSSYGSTGVNYGSTGASYGSTGGHGSVGGLYHGVSNSTVASTPAVASLVSNLRAEEDSVYLTVKVPGSAKVFVNENPTTSTGAVRQFVSRGLEEGKTYRFEIRAEITDSNGDIQTESKTVSVTAGEREQLEFAFSEVDTTLETSITLHVPEDAKVTLAGRSTKAIGSERTFRTQHLKPGQVWDDYEVEVRLGEQVKRQTVRLLAGDSLQLNFNFDEDSTTDLVASR